jgi:hypothetical protein
LTRDDRNKQRFSGGPITGDGTGVEIYGTIFAVAESPKDSKLLWVGSDDGLVHRSRNNGTRWENVTTNIPDLPDWATIRSIEPSPFDAGTAYLVADAHRLDDHRPYVWKTSDYGQTWKKITEGLDPDVYAHVIREDPRREGLLYLGTERGLMISFDGGDHWQPFSLNVPTVAVHDIVVKDDDLVLGTMGRGIWILDDLAAVREWKDSKSARLFPIQPAVRWRQHGHVSDHHEKGVGENPPEGAIIQYFLPEKPKKPIAIEVLDSHNKRVILIDGALGKKPSKDEIDDPWPEEKRPEVPAETGVNRFAWDLRHQGARIIPKSRVDAFDPAQGPLVSPGVYTVRVNVDGKILAQKLEVRLDPRVSEPRGSFQADKGREIIEIAPREADGKASDTFAPWLTRAPGSSALIEEARHQEQLALRLRDEISKLSGMVDRVSKIRRQLDLQADLFEKDPRAKSLVKQNRALSEHLEAWEARVYNPKAEVTYDILAMKGGARLYSQLTFLLEIVDGADGAPTQGMDDRAAELIREREAYEGQLDQLLREELPPINDLAKKIGAPLIATPKN